jgi:methionyl-tRNA formyltransferase
MTVLDRHPAAATAQMRHPAEGPPDTASAAQGSLRVLVITEDDPIYVVEFFRVFFAEYPRDRITIVGITVDRAFHEPLARTLGRMLRFYGPVGTVRQGLRFVGAKLSGRSIEAIANEHGVPVLSTPSVNAPEYLERIRALGPEVVLSVAGPEIFSPELLAIAPLGCINIHSGRLPTYRGMLPSFWQMLRGEPAVTITVHRMVERLDAGDVLATRDFPIRPRDTLDRVIRGTKREGARLFLDVLDSIRAGTASAMPVDMGEASYFRFPTPDDVRAFRRRGHRLL